MPETRVQWNADENRIVAVRWIDICKREGINPLQPFGISKLAEEAQLAITDESRRRPIGSMKGTQSIAKLLDAVAQVLEERKRSAKAQETSERQERESAEQLATELRQQQEQETLTRPAPPEPLDDAMARQAPLEDLVRAFGAGIATILVSEITKAVRATFTTEFAQLHARTLAVSKVLPRILVVGPLPKQQPMLEEAVMGVADLKFVASEENAKLVKLRGQNCAAAVVWINYVNHSHSDACRALFGDNRTVFAKGGMDTLKAKIEETALHAQIPEQLAEQA